MKTRYNTGLLLLIGMGIILNSLYLLGQTMSLINYDFTVSIGLQEPDNDITKIGVALNKGFGFGDTFIYMPMYIIGIIGLLKRKAIGFYMMIGAMAITAYWPVVCLATVFYAKGSEGWHFTSYMEYSILLSFISLYGIWGFYYLLKNYHQFIIQPDGQSLDH